MAKRSFEDKNCIAKCNFGTRRSQSLWSTGCVGLIEFLK
jgi:hypothetical protein